MKNLGVKAAVSIYELTRLEPVYKTDYIGNGKYKSVEIGKKKVPLIERGTVGIDGFYTARKTSFKKQMWAIWRLRRSRTGQLRLL